MTDNERCDIKISITIKQDTYKANTSNEDNYNQENLNQTHELERGGRNTGGASTLYNVPIKNRSGGNHEWCMSNNIHHGNLRTKIPELKNKGIRINFSNIDLFKSDLSGIDLTWSDFRNAILTDANLKNTILEPSDLSGAILVNTNLQGTNLLKVLITGNTVFDGSTYNDKTKFPFGFGDPKARGMIYVSSQNVAGITNTIYNVIMNADVRNLHQWSKQNNVNINNIRQRLPELRVAGIKIDLSNSSMRNINFDGLDLSGADLSGADLSQGRYVEYGKFNIATYDNNTIFPANFGDPKARGMINVDELTNTTTSGTSTRYGQIKNNDGKAVGFNNVSPANPLGNIRLYEHLKNNTIIGGLQNDYDLAYADFSGTELIDVPIIFSDLRNAKFNNSKLEYVNFQGSNLSDTNFSGATLKSMSLKNINLSGANFSNADVSAVDFTETNLINATYNDKTIFPANFGDPKARGMIKVS